MAAGDAQRIWYPEMLEQLKAFWSPQLPWNTVIAFCERMTVMRKDLALSRDIKPPIITCHACGTRARAAYPTISVRSVIFALKKIQPMSDAELKAIDLDWKRYKRKNALTGYGQMKSAGRIGDRVTD